MMNKNTAAIVLLAAIVSMMAAHLLVGQANAAPAGANIMSNYTSGAPTRAPDSRADDRGTITTIVLNSIQQDYNWKAYVGTVTGRLSLDNADGYTIYDWPASPNKDGEVYISRANSLVFGNVSCANAINITSEDAFFLKNPVTETDSINQTFNYTSHQAFAVGSATGVTNIAANSCRSTATYINATNESQVMDGSQIFQEILLQDSSDNLIFVSMINASRTGYNGSTFDFQMIVPEKLSGAPTTYYFFTELG